MPAGAAAHAHPRGTRYRPQQAVRAAATCAAAATAALLVTDASAGGVALPESRAVLALAAGILAAGILRHGLFLAVAPDQATPAAGGRGRRGAGVSACARHLATLTCGTAIGVAVVELARLSPWTLLVLPPAALALTVARRTRLDAADDDNQYWATFAVTGREFACLDTHDEEAIVEIARLRAAELFRAGAVQITLVPPGRRDAGEACPPPPAGDTDKSVALAFGDEPLGVLTLSLAEPASWNARDERMLSAFAYTVAAALAHARLCASSRAHAERAEHDAAHDWLTGLGNRRLLVSRADAALATLATATNDEAGGTCAPGTPGEQARQARQGGKGEKGRKGGKGEKGGEGGDSGKGGDGCGGGCVGLLLVDLDRFKDVNDAFGHAAGDAVLRAVAERLRRSTRADDVVARVGGDEFAVLVTGIADPSQAEAVAAELSDVLSRPVDVDGTKLAVEVCVGVACHPDDGTTTDELLQHADIAMYKAKKSHPRWRRYEADDRATQRARLELIAELRSAIGGGELVLNYQPQLNLRSGRVSAVEALVRWHHPRRGMLTPAAFVPAVEQSGLIQSFTYAILDQALTACAAWRAQGHDVAVSVNVSANNLVNADLPGDVAKLLVTRGVNPSRLTLEITETARMNDAGTALRLLRELRDIGVRIAADDFGTGYSSFPLLQERILHEVKIDRSFVRRLLVERGDAAIVAATVQLAHAHGLSVVAEGVENAELLDALAALSCDQVQGLHIGPAMPVEELTTWLAGCPSQTRRRAVGDTVQIFVAPHQRPDYSA